MRRGNTKSGSVVQEVLAGAGIGLLVGLLVGLSVSEVVGGVIGSLTALLAAFFGLTIKLRPESSGNQPATIKSLHAWRIFSFGLICTAGVVAGLVIRTHNFLSPSPMVMVENWEKAGYSPEEARMFVAMQEFGVVPKGMQLMEQGKVSSAKSVLFADASELSSKCWELQAKYFAGPNEWVEAFINAGGKWQSIGEAVKDLDTVKQKIVLDAVWKFAYETENTQ